MKIKIVIGLVALAVNGAMASPRTDYLIEKIKEAVTVEAQSRGKLAKEKLRYEASRELTKSFKQELKDTLEREAKQGEQIRRTVDVEYLRVGNINTEDMTAPVSIRLVR
tara:strand:+ start:1905 stop:2231 length:327 start_codon:yes stop_codon:yes gene_type:complete